MYDGRHSTPSAGLRSEQQGRDRSAVQIIPYDYVATFDLEGTPGRLGKTSSISAWKVPLSP